jgi:hypothetical protein
MISDNGTIEKYAVGSREKYEPPFPISNTKYYWYPFVFDEFPADSSYAIQHEGRRYDLSYHQLVNGDDVGTISVKYIWNYSRELYMIDYLDITRFKDGRDAENYKQHCEALMISATNILDEVSSIIGCSDHVICNCCRLWGVRYDTPNILDINLLDSSIYNPVNIISINDYTAISVISNCRYCNGSGRML